MQEKHIHTLVHEVESRAKIEHEMQRKRYNMLLEQKDKEIASFKREVDLLNAEVAKCITNLS